MNESTMTENAVKWRTLMRKCADILSAALSELPELPRASPRSGLPEPLNQGSVEEGVETGESPRVSLDREPCGVAPTEDHTHALFRVESERDLNGGDQ